MVIFLMICIGMISYYTFSRPEMKSKMMFNASKVYHGKEYYRLLTSGFIHADWFHLGFNLYALHLFSKTLIQSFTQAGFSNPELKPEEVESWEVGLDQTFMDGKIIFSTVYFDADYDDLIQFSIDTFQPENIANASSKGVETNINFKLPNNFFLGLNHTWNEAIDKSTGEQLRRRAEHKFHANLQHNWCDKLKSTLGLTYRDETNDGSVVLDSYVVVRSSLVYQYNKKVKFTLRGENLFDEEYEEISGFGTAGVSGYAGFTYSF